MRSSIFAAIASFFISSCQTAGNFELTEITDEIKKTDIAFSDLSKQKGMRVAFLEYIDSTGVLLRPDHYPIIGKDAIRYLKEVKDTVFNLTWLPQNAVVAHSGELGYSYGVYTFSSKDTSFEGTYVSIWKKNSDGQWKFVLDTGNPGVGSGNK